MKLSEKAWQKAYNIVEAIKISPFIKELMIGTLSKNKFLYYIEQDILYLKSFSRCLAILASKVPQKYIKYFLKYSESTIVTESEIVHAFFKKNFNFHETGKITRANLSYTSYLFKICLTEPVEIGIAAILPCFWVYLEVCSFILKNTNCYNQFIVWIKNYSSDDFINSVNEIIALFDTLGSKSTENIQKNMLNTFYTSTCLEYHFFNDVFLINSLDNIK